MTPTLQNFTLRQMTNIIAVQFTGTIEELEDIGDWVRDQAPPEVTVSVMPFPKALYFADNNYFLVVEEYCYIFFDSNNRLKKLPADVFEAMFELQLP